MDTLVTDRLRLRPLALEDAAALYVLYKSPQVGPNAGWKPYESQAEAERVLGEVFLPEDACWGIEAGGCLIGTVGLVKDDRRREVADVRMLGYSLGEGYWGSGYATEAGHAVMRYGFETLGLRLITAYSYPHNTRSHRVLVKLGFEREAVLRGAEKRFDGQLMDLVCFACEPEAGAACNTVVKTV